MKLVPLLLAVAIMFGVPWITALCLGLSSSAAAKIGASAILAGLFVYLSVKPASSSNRDLFVERELVNGRRSPPVR